jgi:hypothetical protein
MREDGSLPNDADQYMEHFSHLNGCHQKKDQKAVSDDTWKFFYSRVVEYYISFEKWKEAKELLFDPTYYVRKWQCTRASIDLAMSWSRTEEKEDHFVNILQGSIREFGSRWSYLEVYEQPNLLDAFVSSFQSWIIYHLSPYTDASKEIFEFIAKTKPLGDCFVEPILVRRSDIDTEAMVERTSNQGVKHFVVECFAHSSNCIVYTRGSTLYWIRPGKRFDVLPKVNSLSLSGVVLSCHEYGRYLNCNNEAIVFGEISKTEHEHLFEAIHLSCVYTPDVQYTVIDLDSQSVRKIDYVALCQGGYPMLPEQPIAQLERQQEELKERVLEYDFEDDDSTHTKRSHESSKEKLENLSHVSVEPQYYRVHKYVDDSQVIQSVSDGIITFSIDEFTCSLGKPQDYYGEFQIGFHECLMWHHRSHSLLLVNYSQKNLDETRIQAIKKFHVGARHGPLTHSIDQWSLVGTCIIYLDFCDSRPMLRSIHVDSLKSQKVECFSRKKSVMTVPEKVVSLESNGRVITLLCKKYNDMTKVVYGWIDFSGRCTNIESFVYTSHPSYVSRSGKNNSDITGTVTEDMKYFICLEHRDDDRVEFFCAV